MPRGGLGLVPIELGGSKYCAERGRAEIDGIIASGRLERVSADRTLTYLYLEEARWHLNSSELITETDPTGSFPLACEASRRALVAMLINPGLRLRSRGRHVVIEEALRAQLTPPMNEIVDGFGWMRALRNASEYLSFDRPSVSAEDAAVLNCFFWGSGAYPWVLSGANSALTSALSHHGIVPPRASRPK